MRSLGFIVVALLCSLLLVESFKISSVYRSLVGGRSDTPRTEITSDPDEDGMTSEHVDCSEVKSMLGRAVKWILDTSKKVPRVRFFLSSRIQPTPVEVYEGQEFRLDPTDFRSDRRTVLITHGFKSSGFKGWVQRMRSALLSWADVNVIVVDWSGGSKSYNYLHAAINTKEIGNTIARFLRDVVNVTKSAVQFRQPTWGPLHLVGHSLGAHISGIAAREFREMGSDWRVSRITGLDPAELCFHDVALEFRLDNTDADFVDVIHTSSKTKSTFGFGMPDPIGHVDFYANGGNVQPGCTHRNGSLWKYVPNKKTPIEIGKCSHQRSYHYFTESVVSAKAGNCTFWAKRWDPRDADTSQVSWETCNANDCTEMGIRSEMHDERGTFYATTSATAPFCIPPFHIK
ncbi:phospholipase A1-like [Venturia canescens]|uniref:phospholipase A1-like n=1 Tax=Venturia canescens TaxID=32260 RepID=UPI001C9BC4EC|nr:phospholipase A1-like [Venturia canescens]XP_043289189.1 phospholipase A1-like [Venturia canescens]